jgi:hypothetical protein
MTCPANIGAWKNPEGFVAQYGFDVRELPQGEDGLVPAQREFPREGEEPHQVTVITTEFQARRIAPPNLQDQSFTLAGCP